MDSAPKAPPPPPPPPPPGVYTLAAIVANLYMEELEDQTLEAATLRLRMWVRYVDDTFVLWPHYEKYLVNFHQHLNLQHPAIQLTMEREQQNKIAFLDVLVAKIQKFVTSVAMATLSKHAHCMTTWRTRHTR